MMQPEQVQDITAEEIQVQMGGLDLAVVQRISGLYLETGIQRLDSKAELR